MKNKNNKKLLDCCNPKKEYKGNNPLIGIFYGIVPHIGCIMFIIGAILGSTILLQFFKPFLMNRYIFHYLMLLSIGFATIYSFLYLRKNKLLSLEGIKKKKVYLSIMYGSTIGINLILFFFIFPLLANASITKTLAYPEDSQNLESVELKVNILCSGHAPLISNEIKTIDGVANVKYSFPNNFEIQYDRSKTSLDEILRLEVFKEYPANIFRNEQRFSQIKEVK